MLPKFLRKELKSSPKGFTLIELLVVIFIIGILASIILVNIAGIRGRAKDAKKKNDLMEMKKALRLYYNDHQGYPLSDDHKIDPDYVSDGEFYNPDSNEVYMKDLPDGYLYDCFPANSDEFRLRINLENISDEAIDKSQEKCPNDGTFGGITYNQPTFVVCED